MPGDVGAYPLPDFVLADADARRSRAHAARVPRRDGAVRDPARRRLAVAGPRAGGGRLPQRLRAVQPRLGRRAPDGRDRPRPRVARPARVGRRVRGLPVRAADRSREPGRLRIPACRSRPAGSPCSAPPTCAKADGHASGRPTPLRGRDRAAAPHAVLDAAVQKLGSSSLIVDAAAAGDAAQQAVLDRGDAGIYERDIAYLERHAGAARVSTRRDVCLRRAAARLPRAVEDRLDVVAVRVEHERRVVARVVARPRARGAVVGAPGRERGGVEGIDRRPVGRGEGECTARSGRPPGWRCPRRLRRPTRTRAPETPSSTTSRAAHGASAAT